MPGQTHEQSSEHALLQHSVGSDFNLSKALHFCFRTGSRACREALYQSGFCLCFKVNTSRAVWWITFLRPVQRVSGSSLYSASWIFTARELQYCCLSSDSLALKAPLSLSPGREINPVILTNNFNQHLYITQKDLVHGK